MSFLALERHTSERALHLIGPVLAFSKSCSAWRCALVSVLTAPTHGSGCKGKGTGRGIGELRKAKQRLSSDCSTLRTSLTGSPFRVTPAAMTHTRCTTATHCLRILSPSFLLSFLFASSKSTCSAVLLTNPVTSVAPSVIPVPVLPMTPPCVLSAGPLGVNDAIPDATATASSSKCSSTYYIKIQVRVYMSER